MSSLAEMTRYLALSRSASKYSGDTVRWRGVNAVLVIMGSPSGKTTARTSAVVVRLVVVRVGLCIQCDRDLVQ